MTTATAKKANRGHLIRMAKAGRLFVKCRLHLTDDYAFDAAMGFGKQDEFTRVYLAAEYESPISEQINELYQAAHPHMPDLDELERLQVLQRQDQSAFRDAENEKAEGCIKMRRSDFRTKSGHCSGTKESGSFSVHSNLHYDYEIR